MIRIIICDDHPIINQGIESYFASHNKMRVVATANSVAKLRTLLATTTVDVLLLDINLPDGDGMELCAEVKKSYLELKVLGLSSLDERSVILRMLENGASGYLLKNAPMEEIEKAILHIYDGGVYLGTYAQSSLISQKKDDKIEIPPVTRREKEVLYYLAKGLSSIQIAEKMFVSPLTVDTHRRNLLQKFKVGKTVNLLQKAKKAGILD